jgi:endonuclease YncB( thermonuclease family)
MGQGAGRALALAALLLAPPAVIAPTALPRAAAGPEVSGRASVTDGDTLRIGAERIRLHAIDAPETGQRCGAGADAWDCGAAATARLEALTAGGPVRCLGRERDRYGRLVSVCSVGGTDLGGLLVAEGLARAYVRYGDDYAPAEARARAARLGLWRGEAEAPWDHRASHRARAAPPPAADPRLAPLAAGPGARPASGGCAIKGNVSSRGRIYHLPGSPAYADTRIDPARGEAFFCDEAAARAAGFRPVRGQAASP